MKIESEPTEINPREFRERVLKGDITDRHTLLTVHDAASFQKGLIGQKYSKLFFGVPLDQAIGLGYSVSRRSFFETSHSPVAQIAANTTRRLLDDIAYGGDKRVLDLFTGTGHYAWAFANEGFTVDGVEQDTFTAECAQSNIRIAGVDNVVAVRNMDARAFLRDAQDKDHNYAAIFLDPPWNETYNHDITRPFSLKYADPPLDELVAASQSLTPVIAFKVPQNVDTEEILTLAGELNNGVLVQRQIVGEYDKNRPTGVVIAYMSSMLNGHIEEQVFIDT